MRINLCIFHRAVLFFAIVVIGSPLALAQKDRTIADVQGASNASKYVGDVVRLTGIVTARTRTGFFLQTPDDRVDSDPNTSEGIFVFTRDEPAGEAAVGNLVSVTGMVEEFYPRSDPNTLRITELAWKKGLNVIQVLGKAHELPRPIVLTLDHFKKAPIDVLERFEGMRVVVPEMTVTSPTDGRVDNKNNTAESNGIFYGVVKGLPRSFREPGLEVYQYLFMSEKEQAELKKKHPKIALFDCNPERLRVESAAQLGSQAINVAAGSELKNVTGVLHYAYRTYSILTDVTTRPSIVSVPKPVNMPVPTDRQFSVAAMNLENLFDDEDDPNIKEEIVTTDSFAKRLKKMSATIRVVMQTPDVIGIVEVENLSSLQRLAARVNADSEITGKPNPKYEAHLLEGNDGRGINVGFLVRSTRVKVLETKQLGKDIEFKNANTKEDNFLNDRPSLMLRAAITDSKTSQPFEFTVVVNHLKSFNGYNDPKQMDNVRLKKKLQAEFLARWVNERQKANPQEKIILVGDFNFYQFNDGIMDVIGTIKGTPAAKDQVMMASDDLVEADMMNLVDYIKLEEQYSYRFDGNGQVLDHIIISANLMPHANGFGFARVNADFPESYRSEDRAERFSDHDAPVAYFSFEPKVSAPKTP